MKKFITYKQSKEDFDEMIKNIANICAIPSISEEDFSSEFPFGKETDNALNYALNLAKSFGFNIYKDPKNRYGFAEFGKGDKIIGILAHLDVVPAGDESQWRTSAFVPVITNESIIGRGSLDDKGPAIINLYAMKYIYDHGLLSDEWKIRIIFGISEETTMKSMKSYLADFKDPYISYTPDGEWPLIYAEKMIYVTEIHFPKVPGVELNGGDVVNQIPDSTSLVLNEKPNIIKGIGGHGSTPEKGDNAIIKAINIASKENKEFAKSKLFKFIKENLNGKSFNLSNIFKNYSDFSGELSANLGIIRTLKNEYVLTFDFRVPVSHKIDDVTKNLNDYLKDEFGNDVFSKLQGFKEPKYIEQDSPIVRILMDTYNEAMNSNEKPLAIGGGTFARLIKTCVAFGSTKYMHLMHGPNEYFTFDEIKSSLEIYINALNRLQDLEE